jgi:glycosyltransferase involved in cell wall biosynthesis
VRYWKKHGTRLEPELIKKADLVLTNSTYYQKKAANNNRHSYYIGQGCDFSIYNKNKVTLFPDELINVKRPIIGYVGALSVLRLDINLLKYLAIQNKKWSIVLIGPEDRDFQKSSLHALDNVFFLGQKKLQDLPNYINAFDVALNPQKVNEITIGNYPRKIDEYLAFGKPVVATRTDAMSIFEKHVYLAEDYNEYVQMIQLALRENNEVIENDRIDFARNHVWEKSVNLLYEKINIFSKNETQVG